MNDVVAGSGSDTAKIARVSINTSLLGAMGTPKLESVNLERPVLPPTMALRLLDQAADPTQLKAGELRATGLVFGAGLKDLPPLTLQAALRDGRLTSVSG